MFTEDLWSPAIVEKHLSIDIRLVKTVCIDLTCAIINLDAV